MKYSIKESTIFVVLLSVLLVAFGCSSDEDNSNKVDGDNDLEAEKESEVEVESEAEAEAEAEIEEEIDYVIDNLLPPEKTTKSLDIKKPKREIEGDVPTKEEITAFTKKVTGFFKDSKYFDWAWRMGHGLDKSYNSEMMDYKLWWQDVGYQREGDTIVFVHRGKAENILKRTVKVMDGTIGAYLLTGDERIGELATQYLKGIVALSLGFEFGNEDPLVKYIQPRAIFNHDHEYTVDDRKVKVQYSSACEPSFKWNVHVFENKNNPAYGNIWVSNMRSKDDVPYVYMSMPIVTKAYHQTKNKALSDAAKLYIEYIRGFSQHIVDNNWYIMTKYEDGKTVKALDYTKKNKPEADLGSFVHWRALMGDDAECTAQLGAALTGYGDSLGLGDCGEGLIGWDFEKFAGSGNWFNYNIYNYFHIGALAAAEVWGRNDLAEGLMKNLPFRFDEMLHNKELGNRNHKEFQSDMSGWMISAATHGYPLNVEEARHIMKLYGESSEWYTKWEHWDPWATLPEDTFYNDYKAPRCETITDGEGNKSEYCYVRLVEMPYVFEYCASDVRDKEGVQFIDCDIVSDPSKWGED